MAGGTVGQRAALGIDDSTAILDSIYFWPGALPMKFMLSKQITDRYRAFARLARREPVFPVSQERQTLVTISIDRARRLPGAREQLGAPSDGDRQARLARLLALGGIGARLVGEQTPAQLAARSRQFRGNE